MFDFMSGEGVCGSGSSPVIAVESVLGGVACEPLDWTLLWKGMDYVWEADVVLTDRRWVGKVRWRKCMVG
jgi:hypothetical protein